MLNKLICDIVKVNNYIADDLSSAIQTLLASGSQSIMILGCDTEQELTSLHSVLSQCPVPIFGGIYPDVIWQNAPITQGFLLLGLHQHVSYQLNLEISNSEQCKTDIKLGHNNTLLVFIDGLSSQIETCTQALFDWLGNSAKVIGGGAGSLSFEQKPCIISNQGIFADAMLTVPICANTNIAIAHGWETIAGPFLATKVDHNRIKELNFKPAFEVYQTNIKSQSDVNIDENNFFQQAHNFPIGVDRLDDDMLVRDPIKLQQQEITCVGSVPENSMLYILSGDKCNLIDSSSSSAKQLPKQTELIFVVDCISRKLFLKERFNDELLGIKQSFERQDHFIAILALGEIATGMFGAVNFHNKTSVMATLSNNEEAKCRT